MSVFLKFNFPVTTEPIGFYSSWNISTGPMVVLSYLLQGQDTRFEYWKKDKNKMNRYNDAKTNSYNENILDN